MQGKDMSINFPNIKAIMWFDELKVEAQAGGAVIDWRFTGNQQIQSGLGIYIQTPAKSTGAKYWLQLSDFVSSSAQLTCSATTAPNTPTTPATTPTATTQSIQSSSSYISTTPPTVQAPPVAATQGMSQNQVASLAGLIGRRLLA
jgi:hypothetical protein